MTNLNYPGTVISVSLPYDALNRVPHRVDGVGATACTGWSGGRLPSRDGHNSGTGAWSTHNFYHADGNGNVTMLVNASQTAVATCHYDPFGNTMHFSSKPHHPTTPNSGLYNYGYRWYAPNLRRWISRDPIGEEGGAESVCLSENRPTARVEIYGNKWWEWVPLLSTGIHAYQRFFGHVPGICPEDYGQCLGLSGIECSKCVFGLLAGNLSDYTGGSIGSDIFRGLIGGTVGYVGWKLGRAGFRGGGGGRDGWGPRSRRRD